MQGNGDRRSRLIEVGITIICSAIVSAVTVAWSLCATLAAIHERDQQQDRSIANNLQQISALSARDLTQIAQIAAQERTNQEILRRLERIEDKLDRR